MAHAYTSDAQLGGLNASSQGDNVSEITSPGIICRLAELLKGAFSAKENEVRVWKRRHGGACNLSEDRSTGRQRGGEVGERGQDRGDSSLSQFRSISAVVLAEDQELLSEGTARCTLRSESRLDRFEVSKGSLVCGQHLFEGSDLCVLKHQIVSRSRPKIDAAIPELLLSARIMLGYVNLEVKQPLLGFLRTHISYG